MNILHRGICGCYHGAVVAPPEWPKGYYMQIRYLGSAREPFDPPNLVDAVVLAPSSKPDAFFVAFDPIGRKTSKLPGTHLAGPFFSDTLPEGDELPSGLRHAKGDRPWLEDYVAQVTPLVVAHAATPAPHEPNLHALCALKVISADGFSYDSFPPYVAMNCTEEAHLRGARPVAIAARRESGPARIAFWLLVERGGDYLVARHDPKEKLCTGLDVLRPLSNNVPRTVAALFAEAARKDQRMQAAAETTGAVETGFQA